MFFRKLAAATFTLLAAFSASAAPLAERSPFLQGHWWDPTRSGNGFELFSVGADAMAIWYTFDNAGNPVWYTAQGAVGAPADWPLLRHRWVNGRRGAFETVGTLRLTFAHPESARVDFAIAGRTGSWTIQPFNLSGVANEVDHSGSYFNPANSGWGLTLTQQGDVLGGVLYTYDAGGAPTWYAGFDRGSTGSVNFISARGACPSCAYTATTTQSAGRLTFDFRSEASLVIRNQLAAPMAAGVNVDGASLVQLGRPASTRPADRGLATFSTDASLREYLVAGMLALPMMGGGIDFSAAPPATTFSTTNLQEAGVDEADRVKTDGTRIYTFGGTYVALPQIRVARVLDDGASLDVVGTVPLTLAATGNAAYTYLGQAGLYVHANQLTAVTSTVASGYSPVGIWGYSTYWTRGVTNIEIFDTTPAGLPESVWRAQIDGHMISSRRIGDRLYVVARHVPFLQGFFYGAQSGAALEANRQILASVPLASLLPTMSINGSSPIPIVSSTAMHVPPQGSRAITTDMILVYAIDLPRGRIVQSLGILGTAEAVYASPGNLYVASSRHQVRTSFGSILPEPSFYTTDVHQVRLAPDSMSVVASGTVEGILDYNPDKAAFRMSEQAGRLRIVTSSNLMWGGNVKNRLTILEPAAATPGMLKTVAFLPNAQRPEPLGKPGELLYSTRFAGDRLYAVTFKKVDPLYVVDLSNAADPKIAGALEIPGFSEYLHPLPNGLLLGFGKDARPASTAGDGDFAWYQGLQLTLFDVSNAGAPREMQRVLMGKRGSDSPLLRDHHAFSSLARPDGTLSIGIPARLHGGDIPLYGTGDSASYPFVESGLLRFSLAGSTPVDARLTQLPSLVTHAATPSLSGSYPPEAGAGFARSILFRNGSVYVSAGSFWLMDANGGRTNGPY